MILRTKGADKTQILQVTPDTVLYAKATRAITPLGVCEKVAEVIRPMIVGLSGPVKGQEVVGELRTLASAARERVLAEAAATLVI